MRLALALAQIQTAAAAVAVVMLPYLALALLLCAAVTQQSQSCVRVEQDLVCSIATCQPVAEQYVHEAHASQEPLTPQL